MKKNKGFTLVELLAVIVILGILAVVAVPNVNSLMNKSKNNMFCKKVESIESAAKYYAQDNLSNLATEDENVIANKIPIRLLVEKGYLKKDDDNCTIGVNCVTDPRDKSSLDNNYIDIYSENNRFYGRYLYNSDDANNKVCGEKINYNVNQYGTYSSTENPLANLANEYSTFDVNSDSACSDLPFYFDLYINGKLVGKSVYDYCVGGGDGCSGSGILKGSLYKITNIRPRGGNTCSEYGVTKDSDALSGIVTSKNISIAITCVKK